MHPTEEALLGFCGASGYEQFHNDYKGWVDETLQYRKTVSNPLWTKSITVGSKGFIE
jgi:hypothetical protein